jgi:hypothetical protein
MRKPRFTVRRIMAAVGAVALLLAGYRFVSDHLPHIRECWRLAAYEEQKSQVCRKAAQNYRKCLRAVPCQPSEYCWNACLTHNSSAGQTKPPTSAVRQTLADSKHQAAIQAYEKAADAHAERAKLYRRAAFRFNDPLPSWPTNDDPFISVSDRYRCDTL